MKRILRAFCWWIGHTPDSEGPIKEWHGRIAMRQWQCRRCHNKYWTFGWSQYLQVHDDDPRLPTGIRNVR